MKLRSDELAEQLVSAARDSEECLQKQVSVLIYKAKAEENGGWSSAGHDWGHRRRPCKVDTTDFSFTTHSTISIRLHYAAYLPKQILLGFFGHHGAVIGTRRRPRRHATASFKAGQAHSPIQNHPHNNEGASDKKVQDKNFKPVLTLSIAPRLTLDCAVVVVLRGKARVERGTQSSLHQRRGEFLGERSPKTLLNFELWTFPFAVSETVMTTVLRQFHSQKFWGTHSSYFEAS